MKIKKVFNKN